ncbi:MAG TPA: hypothetical protein VFK78_04415 [Gemmatimonadales bacterium]|nr:hypothetical protein [Gemmatimonadales bacterium]
MAKLVRLGVVTLLAAAAACDGSRSLAPGNSLSFSHAISLSTFDSIVIDSGTVRVRIDVFPDSLVARRVVIGRPGEIGRPERVEGVVASIDTTAGTLTLAQGLVIGYSANTRFRGERDENPEDSTPDVQSDFVHRIVALLAAGHRPSIEADRNPLPAVQAPGDGSFMADVIRLDEAADRFRLELNITSANFAMNSSPPPAGFLTVLGLTIAVDSGSVRLEERDEDADDGQRFEGIVASVDLGGSSATLTDGTILHIVAGSEIESGGHEDDDTLALGSLADVAAAVGAGDTVFAHGEGVLTSSAPRTFDVIEIRFSRKGMEMEPPEHPDSTVSGDH